MFQTPMISFIIPGKPQPKQRPRVTSHGTYTPQATVDYERLVGWQCRSVYKGKPLTQAVKMTVRVFFKLPKRTVKEKGDWHTQRPDTTNVIKAIEDGLNGIAYEDDSQIVRIEATKQWASDDYVIVEIEEV
jgi:Holliday junction resolvase RusA-like endonuclease